MGNILLILKITSALSKIGNLASLWDDLQKLLKQARHLETQELQDAFLKSVRDFVAKTKAI